MTKKTTKARTCFRCKLFRQQGKLFFCELCAAYRVAGNDRLTAREIFANRRAVRRFAGN